ncbi:MAG: histidine kinase [Bacteroidales bacterium]
MKEEKRLDFLVSMGSYKPRFFLIRVAFISTIAFLLLFIVNLIIQETVLVHGDRFKAYFFAILAFNSITEINLLIAQFFARRKWRVDLYVQSLVILVVASLLVVFWVALARKVFGQNNILQHEVTQVVLIIGLLLILMHIMLIVISNLASHWLTNRRELHELKQAKLLSDYHSIKDRLNPHFLFNNLSVLKSLIHYNPEQAEVFVQNFTNVYRYVLKSHEEATVPLEEELKFLDDYVSLHKERIGEGLQVDIRIDSELMGRRIPPITLQLLVENAIKHNVANKQHPLYIELFNRGTRLLIQNRLHRKESTHSTRNGLKTLDSQYRLLAGEGIRIRDDGEHFLVELPLL